MDIRKCNEKEGNIIVPEKLQDVAAQGRDEVIDKTDSFSEAPKKITSHKKICL